MSKPLTVTVICLDRDDVSHIDHTYNNPIDIFQVAFNKHFGKPVIFNLEPANWEDDNSQYYLIYMAHREMTTLEKCEAYEQYYEKIAKCDEAQRAYPRVIKITVREHV